jgi:hypothetical protein
MCHSYGYLFHTSIVQFTEEQLHSNGIESHPLAGGGSQKHCHENKHKVFYYCFFELFCYFFPPTQTFFGSWCQCELSERNCAHLSSLLTVLGMWALGTVIHSAQARACCMPARCKALRVHASSLLAAALSVLASPTAPAASAGAIDFKRKLSPGLITVACAFTWPVYFVATTSRPHAPRHVLPSLTSAAPRLANP